MVSSEVASCIDLKECIVMTSTTYYIAIGTFIFAGVLLVLLIMIAFWTPGFIFLRAKIRKAALIYIINRGQSGRFAVGKAKSEGVLDVSGTGPFIITENSHTRENKSGLPLFFAFGEFAATLPGKWIYVVNKLKSFFSKKGQDIKNVEDFGSKIGLHYHEGAWKKKS